MKRLRRIQELIRVIGKVWVRLEVAIGDLIEETENGTNRSIASDGHVDEGGTCGG